MRPKRFFNPYSIDLKTALFFLVLLILFFGLILVVYSTFRVKNIVLQNVSPNVKLYGLEGLKNVNLLFLSESKLSEEVIAANPYVAQVTVTKKYPNDLLLDLIYHKETADLQVAGGYFLLAENGRILQKLKEKNNSLTTLSYYQKLDFDNYQSGGNIDQRDILKTLNIISTFDNLDSIDIQSADVILCKLKGQSTRQVIFSLANDQATQIYELQTIYRQLKIEGKDFQKIDLRFDKPIITY